MLNPNAAKWVADLKSGEFKQVKRLLANQDGYCCLVIACEVFIREGGRLKKTTTTDGDIIYGSDKFTLPPKVQEWLGLRDNTGSFKSSGEGSFQQLSTLNDEGESFEQIAKIIESKPDGLFQKEGE